ncbi:uncharacterized protein LOC143198456 [Rhynchophorus ferrugineus]|uniref:uncharacterized protein LOC143198456 n=1 Tax=Rhynchophorus ferrugineus TaxID=354439 RepID=UPI003FCC2CD0
MTQTWQRSTFSSFCLHAFFLISVRSIKRAGGFQVDSVNSTKLERYNRLFRTRTPVIDLSDMSLLPYIFDIHPSKSFLSWPSLLSTSDDFFKPLRMSSFWNDISQLHKDITVDKDKFEANVNVRQFKPEEISVKLDRNTVTIEGKHEEKPEHGYISRQFVRHYTLPDDCDAQKLQTKISSDGLLVLSVPKKAEDEKLQIREVPVNTSTNTSSNTTYNTASKTSYNTSSSESRQTTMEEEEKSDYQKWREERIRNGELKEAKPMDPEKLAETMAAYQQWKEERQKLIESIMNEETPFKKWREERRRLSEDNTESYQKSETVSQSKHEACQTENNKNVRDIPIKMAQEKKQTTEQQKNYVNSKSQVRDIPIDISDSFCKKSESIFESNVQKKAVHIREIPIDVKSYKFNDFKTNEIKKEQYREIPINMTGTKFYRG